MALALFVLAAGASPAWAEDNYTLLHRFVADSNGIPGSGGAYPGPVVAMTDPGPQGWALFGVTGGGGINYSSDNPFVFQCPSGCGTVYKLTPPPPGGTHFTESRVYVFKGARGSDGSNPFEGLAFDASGAAYGVTGGGPFGTVFKLTPPRAGQFFWTETIVGEFGARAYGEPPQGGYLQSGVVLDPSGAVYVPLSYTNGDAGSIDQLTPPQSGQTDWGVNVIHRFYGPEANSPPYEGEADTGPLVADHSGGIYGLVSYPGNVGLAEVFRLTPPKTGQASWTYTTLYKPETNNYYVSTTGLVRDRFGTLYFSVGGGPTTGGAVFSLKPPAAGQTSWTPTILHSFSGVDGYDPGHLAILDKSGSVYGAANKNSNGPHVYQAVAFRLDPPASGHTTWTETVLYASPGAAVISDIEGSLTRDAAGTLYTTSPDYYGSVLKLTPP